MRLISNFFTNENTEVRALTNCDSPIVSYAAEELRSFLTQTYHKNAGKCVKQTWTITLNVDSSMPEWSFAASCADGSNNIELCGYNPTCVLHAAYTLLEKLGFVFDINGPTYPPSIDLGSVAGWSTKIVPKIKYRGIRQHINFPMDISGYTLSAAKEYIRNLARMRMNHITFHSYPNQWYEVNLPSQKELAGAFFYGIDYKLHHDEVFKAIHNEKYFCIPEIEPLYEHPKEKSRAAIKWLQELMDEAKRVGLHIQLSYEPRDAELDDCIAAADEIIQQYPMINTLELITQEAGGIWETDAALPVKELKSLIRNLFGSDADADKDIVSPLREGLWQLPGTLRELAKNVLVVKKLSKQWKDKKHPALATGVYCTEHESLKSILAIMRKFVPKDIEITFLPAHGGRASAESINAMEMSQNDMGRSMIYSWLEFDGDMFLQQNGIKGIQIMLQNIEATCKNKQLEGIAFNHWRTSENRTSARYSSLATLFGAIKPEDFYIKYAASLRLGNKETYAKAMQELDDADTNTRDKLGNIGFCHEPCWYNAAGYLGYIGMWKIPELNEIRQQFEGVGLKLNECIAETKSDAGRAYLSFLINRIKCTSIHLKAMAKLAELQVICKDTEVDDFSDMQHKKIRAVFDEAFKMIDNYLDTHSKAMPDRGCEGTLVSYKDTVWLFATKMKAMLLGEHTGLIAKKKSGDAPPPPAI